MLDFVTIDEASRLAGMDPEAFLPRAKERGLVPIPWFENILYRRADIEESIRRAWTENTQSGKAGISRGSRAANSTAAALAKMPKPKPRRPGTFRKKK